MKNSGHNSLLFLLLLIPFLGIMFLQLYVRVMAIKSNYLPYTSVFVVLMLVMIALSYFLLHRFSGNKFPFKRKNIKFNRWLILSYLLFTVLLLISDIIVPKKYFFISLILLLLFTGFFIIWGQFKPLHREYIFNIYVAAIETGFLFFVLICFLFRPVTPGIRYAGLTANPNVLGLYIIVIWAVLLTRLDSCIGRQKSTGHCVFTGIKLGIAAMFMYMTGARTSFLTIGIISFLWFFMRYMFSRRKKRPVMKYIGIAGISLVLSFIMSLLILTNLPDIINHPITFERDREFTYVEPNCSICLASEKNSSDNYVLDELNEEPSAIKRLISSITSGKGLDAVLNGRLSIYKSYLKKVNLKGHRLYGKKVNGSYVVHAHNNIIQLAYSYGALAAIPYIVLCMLALIYSCIYYIRLHDKKELAAFPMLLIISFLISSLTEFIFIPMQSLLAFSFFICIGELMITFANHKFIVR